MIVAVLSVIIILLLIPFFALTQLTTLGGLTGFAHNTYYFGHGISLFVSWTLFLIMMCSFIFIVFGFYKRMRLAWYVAVIVHGLIGVALSLLLLRSFQNSTLFGDSSIYSIGALIVLLWSFGVCYYLIRNKNGYFFYPPAD